jgi:dTDP-4-dehydrorhamnose 3,5-epimerase
VPPEATGIVDCEILPISSNPDDRGQLNEIFRESWPRAFPARQWNACVSKAGVVRGVHVHVDYQEFYTLPQGRVLLGLADIRRSSPTFGRSVQFEWSSDDGIAVVVPPGVAHVFLVEEDAVLVFGLSDYWRREFDNVGCQWDAPELGFAWPDRIVRRSERDSRSGGYQAMVDSYEERQHAWLATR